MKTLLGAILLSVLFMTDGVEPANGDPVHDKVPWLAEPVEPDARNATYNGRLHQLDVTIPKLAAEILVDGILDEAAWRQAALLTGFSQYSPVDRQPAADSTEVLVMYSDHAIYFGIRAFEPMAAPPS
jgi:hypothetical protein